MVVGIMRGILAFVVTSILGGVCLIYGFSAEEWIATVVVQPPVWLLHPLTRFAAIIIGAFLGFIAWKFLPWRSRNKQESAPQLHSEPLATNAPPNRIPLIELRDAAGKQGWDFGPISLHIKTFAASLEQAALDGELSFWGRPLRNNYEGLNRNEHLHPIPREHWKVYRINYGALGSITDNFLAVTYDIGRPPPIIYPLPDGEYGYGDLYVEAERGREHIRRIKPEYEFMSLHEASRRFYEEMRHTSMGTAAEWGSSEDEILNYFGIYMTKTKNMDLFGKRPPSTKHEKISSLEVNNMDIVKGAAKLKSRYHENSKYTELEVRITDFSALLEAAKREWPKENF